MAFQKIFVPLSPDLYSMALSGLNIYKVELKDMYGDSCRIEYDIADRFFEEIDASDIHRGKLHVVVDVQKGAGVYRLAFAIDGTVTVPCDRCLDDLDIPVSTRNELKVKLGSEYRDDDDLIIVPEEDGYIDVAWFIYEFIDLSLPIKRVHLPGECNEEMMRVLSSHLCEETDESESSDEGAEGEDSETDPRWDALKMITNK